MNGEEKQEQTEKKIERQLATAAVYAGKAIRLGIAAITGGLSKAAGLLAGWIGGLVFRNPLIPKTAADLGFTYQPYTKKISFLEKHKTSFLILCLLLGVIFVPFIFVFLEIFASSSGGKTKLPFLPHP